MEMDLVGIKNQNEYYTNHYFTSIFKENAKDTIKKWKEREKQEKVQLPWKRLRDTSRQYYRIRDRYQYSKNENNSKSYVQELADLYLNALGYEDRKSATVEVADGTTVPVYHEETKSNGAPLLWTFLCVAEERGDDILKGKIFEKSDDEDEIGKSVELVNDKILAKLFFAGDEAPRFIILIGINQIALIDRNKWNEKRYLQFIMEDIFSRHEESTFMAITVLLHKESLCPKDGMCVLDNLDENSHKHSAGVSDALKYALRECIEILGNEVIYDMKTRQGIDLSKNPIDASELTLECLRYMYRFLFILFIEARPELGYAPMKSQTYVQGYSLEGLRDVCDRVKEESEVVSEGYYIDDTISELFRMIYEGYPGDLDIYKKALENESLHDVFTIEALKAHIFDPEYTKYITKARLRNSAMLQIVNRMSISRPSNAKGHRGRISYSSLGINQMGAVYEALLSYRGFIAEETLFEVKRAGEKFNELDVGYFIPERELDNYTEDERVRYTKGDKKGQLKKYEQGTFIYRLAGREREKSASYYTPEVLTKCLVKYALKELLKDKTADEILNLTICEPAMGSAAFLNEAINQLAEAYLNKKQEELGKTISFDERFEELQKVKMFIADRNVYGVDLNPIAVELAEVSLWLNTIYKGAYVPWFGTQLVCGNSLIGARKQVYYTSKLEKGKWYDEAPDRIMPGEKRKRPGVSGRVYHFLLGDPGMSNYTDKVIKNLEPDNIKCINDWRKKFTEKFDDEDIKKVLRLSDTIDTLWDRTVELRKKVKKATFEPLSVFGHDESDQGMHTTIREKDEIYQKLFKSEHMNNAGPYARLKAAMDYWCALWFWPIEKAELLPSRQEFFFEMSLILEGGITAVSPNSPGQVSLLDNSGDFNLDESGKVNFSIEGTQLALEFQAKYSDLGVVCLDDLRTRSERLAIANQIAEEQRFQHWELEFADVFENKGGFDLVVGNPPWVALSWNEQDVLSDLNPYIYIKKFDANDVMKVRDEEIQVSKAKEYYIREYSKISGMLTFLNAICNYPLLEKMKTNLFKCFIPLSLDILNKCGVCGFVHPEGIFSDAKGAILRQYIYPKLRQHYQFENELKLFKEVHNEKEFGLNIYGNTNTDNFVSISHLYHPDTIDKCYESDGSEEIPGIKDKNGDWNLAGHRDRILAIHKEELKLFASVFDGINNPMQSKLPMIQSVQLLSTLEKLDNYSKKISHITKRLFSTPMWQETTCQSEGYVKKEIHFPVNGYDMIYTGPHIGVANPLFQGSKREGDTNRSYETVHLDDLPEKFLQRCKYSIACDIDKYIANSPTTSWETSYYSEYKLLFRRRMNRSGERSLISCLVPRNTSHVHAIIGVVAQQARDLAILSAEFESIIYDFFIKITGKTDLYYDTLLQMPFIDDKYSDALIIRSLMLNCCTSLYSEFWEKTWKKDMKKDSWGKRDGLLSDNRFSNCDSKWSNHSFCSNDYERRQLLLEIDVIVAMAIGMKLEELITVYKMQFPVMQQYEEDTWYDKKGKIVFTCNTSLSNIGVDRQTWNKERESDYIEFSYQDDTLPCGLLNKKSIFNAPFKKCNRINDYKEVWHTFEERFANR